MNRATHRGLVVLAAFALLGGAAAMSQDPPDSVRPKWKVGDRWVVQSATQTLQSSVSQPRARSAVRWQFEVKALEPLDGRQCFRIEAKPVGGPATVLWVDADSLMLRQVQAGIEVGGKMQLITESYQAAPGQAAPVLSPMPALPIDLPAFPQGQTKSLDDFTYEATPGPAGEKAVGDIGFSVSVSQQVDAASGEHVKGLGDDPFLKNLSAEPTVGVRLKGPYSQVRQLWKPGIPWPICSDNGTTASRLIEFSPAKEVQR